MIELMNEFHNYEPLVEVMTDVYVPSIDKHVQVHSALGHPILFSGDQMMAARGRGAQKAKMNALLPLTRLEGLVPVAADWHTEVKILDVR